MIKEALLYQRLEAKALRCRLCAHQCRIEEAMFGICGVRENCAGRLYTHAYANPVALNADPVEKKPLYHFLPGSESFSLATAGCNFRCGFCQNWQISQLRHCQGYDGGKGKAVLPGNVVQAAVESGSRSISYTYTEPTIFFEYALDIAVKAKTAGLANIFVTNGYMSRECIEMIRPYLDAANVDLKSFREDFYRRICGARLKPVLETIARIKESGIWLEITTLVVPGENDSLRELSDIADFIAGVDTNIPWHISRFHPDYKFTALGSTPLNIIKQAQEIGKSRGLNYVYAGNVQGWGNDTVCAGCKKAVIKREGFRVLEYNIKENKCVYCSSVIPGVFVA